ncbi:sigma-54-dependent transcriptional regulator [Megalodesulfovibrio gigas]|uniref:Putative two component, sigma54 specific, Fis family transcriptional regulator n=1 Tax=Megalodesulfovibrio gigas (strain ATCC 19364 / DSM 1382 / NCIMB 9332 / VKM B-1759) TaxID=1121448 RepID=T2G9H9_MEGG1|nr:sigma-54 dependent transcriptional regulator [Megalodesulfovibrio gigas]AGW12943.1 putative two component, sigma54 specific, Fis family transcriptional regulator [Megalodesulfovibrio gigas DSM 1382 = ATCC 19364]
MRVLVVDDNPNSLKSLEVVIADLGHSPAAVAGGQEAMAALRRERFPLVVTDIRMPGMDGLELLTAIKTDPACSTCDVVLITGHGDMETAIEALRKGAYDYLNKPINARELAAVIERAAEHQALLRENQALKAPVEQHVAAATTSLRQDLDQARKLLRKHAGLDGVVAAAPRMLQLFDETRLFHANPDVPVLLEGETGVGKEVLARAIHFGESGCDQPFIAINCAAIPTELFESELFGHDPGAYTGSAPRGALGKMELAGQGTLFLDEIAELPLTLQPKLLRVLEERTFYRVGGVKRRQFKARVVCAANQGLEQLVHAGRFRRDLFHRLKVGHLVIPPLRERPQDIEALARHFLQREAVKKRKAFRSLHPDTLALLQRCSWPGNVRELEHAIERAVLLCDDTVLRPEHLSFLASPATACTETTSLPPSSILHLPQALPEEGLDLEALTAHIVEQAVAKFHGNKSRAAAYLGISRFALHRRLQKEPGR